MMRLALGFPGAPVHSSTATARTDAAAFLLVSTCPGYCAPAGMVSATNSARLRAALPSKGCRSVGAWRFIIVE